MVNQLAGTFSKKSSLRLQKLLMQLFSAGLMKADRCKENVLKHEMANISFWD